MSTSTFAYSTPVSPSTSPLQRKFDDERKQKERVAQIRTRSRDCQTRRKMLDDSYKEAMKHGPKQNELAGARSLFQSGGSYTPQRSGKRVHFIPSNANRSVHYELTDSPSVKFVKRWGNYSESYYFVIFFFFIY